MRIIVSCGYVVVTHAKGESSFLIAQGQTALQALASHLSETNEQVVRLQARSEMLRVAMDEWTGE